LEADELEEGRKLEAELDEGRKLEVGLKGGKKLEVELGEGSCEEGVGVDEEELGQVEGGSEPVDTPERTH
jgi:hypothetical protein